tara:strand:+ start:675 stop:1085 length:411 start_codon:yes stop_codon:yes gene_type:complete
MKLKILIVIIALSLQLGCAVKPKYLVEQTLKEKAQQELNARQEEWNWKNRHRIRQQKDAWENRVEILPRRGIAKRQEIRRMRQYRNPQLGIGRNTYNPNKRGQRKHITPKKYNGVAIHRKNYWSKTTNHPQKENKP